MSNILTRAGWNDKLREASFRDKFWSILADDRMSDIYLRQDLLWTSITSVSINTDRMLEWQPDRTSLVLSLSYPWRGCLPGLAISEVKQDRQIRHACSALLSHLEYPTTKAMDVSVYHGPRFSGNYIRAAFDVYHGTVGFSQVVILKTWKLLLTAYDRDTGDVSIRGSRLRF